MPVKEVKEIISHESKKRPNKGVKNRKLKIWNIFERLATNPTLTVFFIIRINEKKKENQNCKS